MSIDILKKELKSKIIRNIYLFYGLEEYLKKYYLNQIETLILQKDFETLNKTVIEDKVDINYLTNLCNTYPMFSERKIIIIKNSNLFNATKKENSSIKTEKKINKNDEFINYLKDIPEYNCVVFFENEIDKRTKLVNLIKQNGLLVEFPYQKQQELVKWVINIFKSKNKEITSLTASKFIEYCDVGMENIFTEINKIDLFLDNKKLVEITDITKICTKSIKSRIFDLTDEIIKKNTNKAFDVLHELMILKEPIPKILFMIARQFRQTLQIKLLL